MTPPPSAAPLEISVVSDVVCPWCFVGQAQLEGALAQWRDRGEAAPVVRWYPFQLNPEMPAQGMLRDDYLRAKFGSASLDAIHARLNGAAASAGVQLALERIERQPNTLKAHALIALAGQADAAQQHAMARRLFAAYFQEGQDLTRDEVLATLAREAGLDDAAIDAALHDAEVAASVAALDADLRRQGVGGVPLFIIGRGGVNHAAVSGAQGTAALLAAFAQTPSSPGSAPN